MNPILKLRTQHNFLQYRNKTGIESQPYLLGQAIYVKVVASSIFDHMHRELMADRLTSHLLLPE